MNVMNPNEPNEPPYRTSRAKRIMEHIRESRRTEHDQVRLFGLNPHCAKSIIPGMSPVLFQSTKMDHD